jgi:SAM-dependent methyltransferase
MSDPQGGAHTPAPLFSSSSPDGQLHAPTFERNGAPILEALRNLLPSTPAGAVIEIGCGSGQHGVALATAFQDRAIVPTDIVEAHRASAAAHAAAAGLSNVALPRALDASTDWADQVADVAPIAMVLAINVVHIAPWTVAEGLFRGAARVLAPGGLLTLYGPFRKNGEAMAPSNEAFDESLRQRDPRWGIRSIDDLDSLAGADGLALAQELAMPANNRIVAWRRR